jgi:hypothetical protein
MVLISDPSGAEIRACHTLFDKRSRSVTSIQFHRPVAGVRVIILPISLPATHLCPRMFQVIGAIVHRNARGNCHAAHDHQVTRSTALAGTVWQLRHWHLSVRCVECGLGERLPVAEQIARHGAHHLLTEVIEKLTCRSCGRKVASVELVNGAVPPQKIPLVWPDKS